MSTPAATAVIAVAAPPGGGKTTLVRRLSARLGGAPTLHYDDYEQITKRSPAEIEAWLDRGAPPRPCLLDGNELPVLKKGQASTYRSLVQVGGLGQFAHIKEFGIPEHDHQAPFHHAEIPGRPIIGGGAPIKPRADAG